MNCSKCGQAVADGSAFCNRCGAPIAALAPPVPPPSQPETEIWAGRFSGKSMGLAVVALVAFAAALVVLFVAKPDLPRWLALTLGGMWTLFALILLVRFLVERWTVRYRLTTERLFEEKGLLRREVTELELIRVDDVSFAQNVIERLFNVGSVSISSTDSDEPRLVLRGIAGPEMVKEMIRSQMKRLRQGTVQLKEI
ncbi:MAG: PH domain-containing protein [Planctomycetes bacterium]|nr:PH domain-containing protein [Planctomycetota bacterium]MBI3844993.1 PH domain-containing protein [Planctomycetota bacterium]